MRRVLPFVLVLLAGLVIGYVLRTQTESTPREASPAEPSPPDAPPAEAPPDYGRLREEVATLRARTAELVEKLAEAKAPADDTPPADLAERPPGPVEIAEETGREEATGDLRISVVDAEGRPAPGVEVKVYHHTAGGKAEHSDAVTGPDGTAELAGLEPGRMTISVKAGGGYRGITAKVISGYVTRASIPVPSRGSTVEGQVRDVEKGPLAKVSVSLTSRGGVFNDSFHGTTAEDGRFRFEGVPPGKYSLGASGGALGYSRRPTVKVEVPEGGSSVVQDIVVGVAGLTGTVRDSVTGNPIPGVNLNLQRGGPYRNVSSDADGVFKFLDLGPGSYSFCVSKDGYGIVFPKIDVPTPSGRWDFELTPAAVLHLLVLDPRGRPCPGRMSFSISSKERAQGKGTNLGTSITADDRGCATYRRIVPGEYTLRLRMDGIGSASVEARVAAGENTVRVQLE